MTNVQPARRVMLGITAGLLCVFGAQAAPTAITAEAQDTDPMSREAVEEIVRDYILKHPEVLLESVRSMQERQRQEAKQRAAKVIEARQGELLHDAMSPVGGNPGGTVTIVEFFDYRCRFCKRLLPTMRTLVQEDTDVRVVYKEFPVLGAESLTAARAALAASAQGKYVVFHEALMANEGSLTMATIRKVAADVGLDSVKLEADMAAPEISAALQRNRDLAEALGIKGTPVLVVGTELVIGAVDLDFLKSLVAQAREK